MKEGEKEGCRERWRDGQYNIKSMVFKILRFIKFWVR